MIMLMLILNFRIIMNVVSFFQFEVQISLFFVNNPEPFSGKLGDAGRVIRIRDRPAQSGTSGRFIKWFLSVDYRHAAFFNYRKTLFVNYNIFKRRILPLRIFSPGPGWNRLWPCCVCAEWCARAVRFRIRDWCWSCHWPRWGGREAESSGRDSQSVDTQDGDGCWFGVVALQ